jgi:hypothetical protein
VSDTLRDTIARVLYEHEYPESQWERAAAWATDAYRHRADAVLAVLPDHDTLRAERDAAREEGEDLRVRLARCANRRDAAEARIAAVERLCDEAESRHDDYRTPGPATVMTVAIRAALAPGTGTPE